MQPVLHNLAEEEEEGMTKKQLENLLKELNRRLASLDLIGEILICGGALMALTYNRERLTEDIDGIFEPVQEIRRLVGEIAADWHVEPDWLNDHVREYLDLTIKESSLRSNHPVQIHSWQHVSK